MRGDFVLMGVAFQILAVVIAHWLHEWPVAAYGVGIPLALVAVAFYVLGAHG